MNLYEKKLAQMERREAKLVYVLTRIPLTKKSEKFFGLHDYSKYTKDQYHLAKLKKHNDSLQEKNPLTFEFTFYYDDPTETETERRQEVLLQSIDALNRFKSKDDKLQYPNDYKIDIEKMEL